MILSSCSRLAVFLQPAVHCAARAIPYSPRSLSTFKIVATSGTTGRSRALACPKNTPCASLWKDQDRCQNRDFYYPDRMLVGTRYFQTNTGRIPTRSGWLDTSFCRVVTWIFVNIFSYFTGQLHVGHLSCSTYQHVIQSNQKQSFGAGTLAFWCFVCSVLLGSIFVSSFEPYLAGHFARNPDTETEFLRLSFWLVHILRTFSENCYTKPEKLRIV